MTDCPLCGHTTMLERRDFIHGRYCLVPGCIPCAPPSGFFATKRANKIKEKIKGD